MPKTVYQLDPSGYYVGPTEADESPLEPGVWLIPAGCIEIPPPVVAGDEAALFHNGAWVVVKKAPEGE